MIVAVVLLALTAMAATAVATYFASVARVERASKVSWREHAELCQEFYRRSNERWSALNASLISAWKAERSEYKSRPN